MTPGTLLAGKFRLLYILGRGSMGDVWAALHVTMGREVAVKLLTNQSLALDARLHGDRGARRVARVHEPRAGAGDEAHRSEGRYLVARRPALRDDRGAQGVPLPLACGRDRADHGNAGPGARVDRARRGSPARRD